VSRFAHQLGRPFADDLQPDLTVPKYPTVQQWHMKDSQTFRSFGYIDDLKAIEEGPKMNADPLKSLILHKMYE